MAKLRTPVCHIHENGTATAIAARDRAASEKAIIAVLHAAHEAGIEVALVPVKPTKEMLEAAWAEALAEDAEGVWREMVLASPLQHREV